MTYTTEEQQLIDSVKTKVSFLSTKPKIINDIFQSEAMQQIIESRIKAAKIELLEELDQSYGTWLAVQIKLKQLKP